MSTGHTESNPTQAVTVKCASCGHQWIGFHLPLSITEAAKLMQGMRCPECAAGADKIVAYDGTDKQVDEGRAKRLRDALSHGQLRRMHALWASIEAATHTITQRAVMSFEWDARELAGGARCSRST